MTSPNRPQLLFLCQALPFPPDGGVEIRSFNVIKLLSREYDVTALCFYRRASRATPEVVAAAVAGLRPYAEAEAFAIPQEYSKSRMILDHLRSSITRRVYTRYAYRSAKFTARLSALLREKRFALVHLDSLDLSDYLPLLEELPVVCTHHNIESELLRRRAATESSRQVRHYIGLQARLMEKEERKWCGTFLLNVMVSADDAQRLQSMVPEARVTVVPNGVDTAEFTPRGGERLGLVFVGGYSWYPNRDAMSFFAESILPLVRERHPDLRVTWVGRAPEDVVGEFRKRYGVVLTGYVPDIRPYVHGAAAFIVPLRVGGGSRLKILDAWAMGKAIVSTTVGCEGLRTVDGENILVRDEPGTFAAAVLDVIENDSLRIRLEENARTTAEDIYDWDKVGAHLLAQYRSVRSVDSKPAPR